MPSKLRKALGAVKDQTSLSLAKVAKSNALEVAVLKATSHDDIPVNDRYVAELLSLISSNKAHASACAHAIARRIGKTRNWIVALKSLTLVLRIFQDGDAYFPGEVLRAMKRGAKILNLSAFRDDSNSSPWDHTVFVRSFAIYLHERLDCFLDGKLQLRTEPVREMKPVMILEKIIFWQLLLDRVVTIRPTGLAKQSRLVHISLYMVVQESFDLYRDINDGLALLLDSFFHLPYQSCVNAFEACVKASKQFGELSEFYSLCNEIGVGKTSEYPSVQKFSEELLETLQEFLKDKSSFPTRSPSPSPKLLLPAPNNNDSPEFDKLSQCSHGDDDGRSDDGSVPADQTSISNPTLDLVSFESEIQKQEQEQEDQLGHAYKDSWEIVLFDASTALRNSSNPSDSEPNQPVDLLSHATPSQRWTNPFLSDHTDFPANLDLPATPQDNLLNEHNPFSSTLHNQDDPFSFATTPTQGHISNTTLQNHHNDSFATPLPHNQATSKLTTDDLNDPLSSVFATPSYGDGSDQFAPATPPQDHIIIAQMSEQSNQFAPTVPRQRHSIAQMPVQNDPFAPPQHHNISQMPLHNDPFAPATPPQGQHYDPFVATTSPKHPNKEQMQLQNVNNDPFVPSINVPQRYSVSKVPLKNEIDPLFGSPMVPHRHSVSTWDPNQPTFFTSPTFFANGSNNNVVASQNGDDPFTVTVTSKERDMSREQRMWLEHQEKIMAKRKI